MPIPAIFIDSDLPVTPGQKDIDDFIVTNWFTGFPETQGTPYSGYYFGEQASNITMNSFNNALPLSIVGSVNNNDGYVVVGADNYLNTNEMSVVTQTVGVCFIRPETPAANTWFIGDFAGSGSVASGWAIGIGSNGKLRVAAQVDGQATTAIAEVDFPAAVAVGDACAVTAFIRQGTVTIAVYDPSTQTYVSASTALSGTRVAGTNSVLIGRKTDNNTSTATTKIRSAVFILGNLSTANHIAVQQYLLAME